MVIGYDEKGLPQTQNVLAKTKGECVEKRKALKAAITLPVPTKTKADMPFGDWLSFWYEFIQSGLRPNTRRDYEQKIRLYICPQLGQIPLNKLTVSDFQRLYTWKKTDGRSQNRETHVAGLFDGEIIF